MPDEGYRWTVSAFKEHILAGDIYQGVPSRRVTFAAPEGGFPIYRRLRVTNPAPYMFFVRMLGMELAGSSPEPLVRVEGRRVSARPIAGTRPRGRDRDPRPAPGARAARRPEGTGGARDAGRPRPQRPRSRLRRRLCPADRADGGRAVHEGDAHRLHRGGRAPRGAPSAGRAGRDVPGGNGDRRAEAPGDGADRRARAHRARPVRRRGRLPHVRGRPGLLHHDPDGRHRRRPRVGADGRRRGRGLGSRERAPRDQGEGRGAPARGGAGRRYAPGRAEGEGEPA